MTTVTDTTEIQHNVDKKDFEQILSYGKLFKENVRKLAQTDPYDDYWKDSGKENSTIVVNCNTVSSWIGDTRHPRRIMEIGTRTGGSLIALLCLYKKEDFEKVDEVISFDMWREYWNTTPLYTFLSKILKKDKWSITIMQRFGKMLGNYIKRTATGKVRSNLKKFNIPTDKLQFISGDSKITVPEYFKQNPAKKFDYILVDGAHDELTAGIDLNNVVAHIDKNGVILFDDITGTYKLLGVWNKFKEQHSGEFDFFEILHGKGVAFAVKK